MESISWRWLTGKSFMSSLLFFCFFYFIAGCNDNGVDPSALSDDAASKTDGATTYEEYGPQTVTLSDNTGSWNYDITAKVSWTGSTTTWTYTITGLNGSRGPKNISHVSIFGFNNCFWNNLSTPGITTVAEGNTGCLDKDAQVIKTAGTLPSLTLTYTFNNALEVNLSAATLYVKSSTDCKSVTIPGPSCETLGLSGNVKQNICEGTDSQENLNYPGVTVTATQGSGVLTTTTDENGNYAFSNIGGKWDVVPAGGVPQSVEVGPADGVADFVIEKRPNGSCAAITGHADKTECVNQSKVTGVYAGATVEAIDKSTSNVWAATTTDANGNFLFSNVPNGSYTVKIGEVSFDVTITGSEGSYNAGTYSIDLSGPICGGDNEQLCSLSQGYWFAKPQAVWPNGVVVIGGKTYTQAEGKAIWNMSNKGGLLNAKAAFLQAAAIKLSGVSSSASVWNDVAIIDAYFSTINKISPTSIPPNSKTGANADIKEAAGRIGDWIDQNHCKESR